MESQKRRPRFKRVSPPSFDLQERDKHIVREVFKHRFLRTSQIAALVEGSDQQISRRLQVLYHGHFLDRPRIQPGRASANHQIIHALGNRGADLLAAECGIARGNIDWTDKNNVKDRFFEHTLMVADVMVALELACRRHGRISLIEPEEILAHAPAPSRARRNPYGWKVKLPDERTPTTIVPDKIFGLHYHDKPEGRNKGYFFLEADRGTMPVVRSNPNRTSFSKKVKAYHQTVSLWEDATKRPFHFQHFRVLTITKPRDRIENLIKGTQQATASGNVLRRFLFAELEVFLAGDPLTLEWRNGRREIVTLLD